MKIGNKLNQLRKLSGMTQEQLAEKIDVSRQTISKWESDSTSPDLESIVKISRIFHVSLDVLSPISRNNTAFWRDFSFSCTIAKSFLSTSGSCVPSTTIQSSGFLSRIVPILKRYSVFWEAIASV